MADAQHLVEYYNDPDAPPATGLVATVRVVVRDPDGRVLLTAAGPDGWGLPGGDLRVGETVADAAVRTTAAAGGVRIEVTGLVGVDSNPHHVLAHPDGAVRQELVVCLSARPAADLSDSEPGQHAPDPGGPVGVPDEPTGREAAGPAPTEPPAGPAVTWAGGAALDRLPVHPATRIRINDALADRARPRIG